MSQQFHYDRQEAYYPNAAGNALPQPHRSYCTLNVPLALQERRIYQYIEVEQASGAGAFVLSAAVRLWKDGKIVGSMPATIADFTGTTPGESIESIFNAGGSPVGDSLVMTIANPFVAGFTSVVLQPVRVNAECDRITLDILSRAGTITGWRALMACISTKY